MNHNLIAISGLLKGTIFALSEDETGVGREASNLICLNELSVSRRHCVIKREAVSIDEQCPAPQETINETSFNETLDPINSQFTIVDLESYNGTFVNGLPIKRQTLAHGDQILVGDVLLLFLLRDPEESASDAVNQDDANLITRSTVRLRTED